MSQPIGLPLDGCTWEKGGMRLCNKYFLASAAFVVPFPFHCLHKLALFLQTCPERPAGLHTSAACVAFIEWKFIATLEGRLNFRIESTAAGR